MSYDLFFLAAVSLLCILVGYVGLQWKASYDRCGIRDPWAYQDAERERRLALLRVSQDLAIRRQEASHRHTVISLVERRAAMRKAVR